MVVVLSCVTILVAFAVMWLKQRMSGSEMQGSLVFAKTYDRGHDIDRIVINTPRDMVELKQKNSYWYVANKGNYWADFKLMHQFLNSINQSVYSIKLPYDETQEKENYLLNPLDTKENPGLLIETFVKDELQDRIIIGTADENELYYFAKRPDKREIWLIDNNFDLPVWASQWLLSPLLSVSEDSIEEVKSEKVYAKRENAGEKFFDEKMKYVNVEQVLKVFNNLVAVDVLPKKDFDVSRLELAKNVQFELMTFYGLKFICTIYYGERSGMWVNIKLSTTPLPITQVNDYIKDNSFLYDGWYFRISPVQEAILRNFFLM